MGSRGHDIPGPARALSRDTTAPKGRASVWKERSDANTAPTPAEPSRHLKTLPLPTGGVRHPPGTLSGSAKPPPHTLPPGNRPLLTATAGGFLFEDHRFRFETPLTKLPSHPKWPRHSTLLCIQRRLFLRPQTETPLFGSTKPNSAATASPASEGRGG